MIEKVVDENFDDVLPLIKEYQEFYKVSGIDEDKNRDYFHQFVKSNENGVLHLLRLDGKAIGFTTIYKGFSSTRAESVAVLNDLYIHSSHRGNGFGKKLILNALSEAKRMGYSRLQWLTSQNNQKAQKLYDGFDVRKSSWFFYAKET